MTLEYIMSIILIIRWFFSPNSMFINNQIQILYKYYTELLHI